MVVLECTECGDRFDCFEVCSDCYIHELRYTLATERARADKAEAALAAQCEHADNLAKQAAILWQERDDATKRAEKAEAALDALERTCVSLEFAQTVMAARKDAEAALSLSQSERVRLAEVVRTWVDKCNAVEASGAAELRTWRSWHAALSDECAASAAELAAARALVAALPRCDDCGKPASSVGAQYDSSGATVIHSCEEHGRYRAYLPYSDELRAYLAARGKEAGE